MIIFDFKICIMARKIIKRDTVFFRYDFITFGKLFIINAIVVYFAGYIVE